MTLVVPNVGEVVALNNLFNKVAPQDQTLFLYSNNITPAETDTFATYTVASWTGYADKSLTGASWTVTGGAPSTAAAAAQTFTSSADQSAANNYGYGVRQTTSTILLFAERFSSPTPPWVIANNGDNIVVTPNFTLE